jgi:hypothetical protein
MNEKNKSIEEIIKSNKDKFDFHVPPAYIWAAIENKLPEPVKKRTILSLWPMMGVAASFLLIGIFGASLFLKPLKRDTQLITIDAYYKNQIEVGFKLLDEHNQLPDDLALELEDLERIEQELKEEIAKNYGETREIMIKRLIDHYKTKLKLIELINSKTSKNTMNHENKTI